MNDQWIVVPGWPKFQHYGDRDPIWLRDYLDQLHRDEYLELTFSQRGLLGDLRKLYAERRGVLRGDPVRLTRALNQRVTRRSLEALNDAGFITLVASKPLALYARARVEREVEKEPPKPPADAGGRKRKTKTTGWRLVRGSHGMTHVPDPNGTDRPPADAPIREMP